MQQVPKVHTYSLGSRHLLAYCRTALVGGIVLFSIMYSIAPPPSLVRVRVPFPLSWMEHLRCCTLQRRFGHPPVPQPSGGSFD
ncbi:hypothetical protein BO71DRAFT_4634 [Aspergillus ellipticus CBS 707.79]|uniref:Uncharacterized protein n=1 Tax=Aspergillus ellipticus CBS 707.79 TaxID=1448320 RepID=A0A319DG97_9EURO|nr:hypothetical protein BO71DRAFT_4634 [Aspergillus ellipticus CBS 707.79]